MNYYNPYFYAIPNMAKSNGIFSKLTFSSFINGTQKTLNLINQAIPVVKQVSPMFKNVKTMFKVMNEFKKNNNDELNINANNNLEKTNLKNDGMPTFFA